MHFGQSSLWYGRIKADTDYGIGMTRWFSAHTLCIWRHVVFTWNSLLRAGAGRMESRIAPARLIKWLSHALQGSRVLLAAWLSSNAKYLFEGQFQLPRWTLRNGYWAYISSYELTTNLLQTTVTVNWAMATRNKRQTDSKVGIGRLNIVTERCRARGTFEERCIVNVHDFSVMKLRGFEIDYLDCLTYRIYLQKIIRVWK